MWSDIQSEHQEAGYLNKKEGEQRGEMHFKLIKNEKELLINQNDWTDRNTTKIHFFNLKHVKYNDKTKQREERF